jgi:hypothetical protein
LLVLVIVLAIPLGWIAKERRQSQREEQITKQLEKQGFSSSAAAQQEQNQQDRNRNSHQPE